MNTTRIHIIGLLMALAAFLWTSCSDDELYRSNELGSRLEEMGDFKLSSFHPRERDLGNRRYDPANQAPPQIAYRRFHTGIRRCRAT